MHMARRGSQFGVHVEELSFDMKVAAARAREITRMRAKPMKPGFGRWIA